MNTKSILLLGILLSFLSCTSEEEKTTQKFMDYVHTLNMDEIKNMSTENTKFYFKMTIEPIVKLGDEAAKKQVMQIASTLKCNSEGSKIKCSYRDENGREQYVEGEFVTRYHADGKKKLLVDIPKKYFFGE